MVLKGKGRILPHRRGGLYLYISKDVANDSVFPFKPSQDVAIRIEKGRLIVEKTD